MGLLNKLFGGAKKKAKRRPPALDFIVLGSGALPAPLALFDPQGDDGKLKGVIGPQPGVAGTFDVHAPLGAGGYLVIGDETAFTLDIADDAQEARDAGIGQVLRDQGSEDAALRGNAATWTASLSLVVTEEGPMVGDPIEAMKRALDISDRLASLGNGVLLDRSSFRVLTPGEWRVEDSIHDAADDNSPPFDPREHFNLHAVDEGGRLWIHSHGLVKLGKPEIELRTTINDEAVQLLLLDILLGAALADFEVGHTTGHPQMPLRIVEGFRHTGEDASHWQGIDVLALVDDGEAGRKSGLADAGLRAMLT